MKTCEMDDAIRAPQSDVPICADHDEDCPGVVNKLKCWLYDPCRGMCPFLRSGGSGGDWGSTE